MAQKLYRSRQDKVIGGVCGGLADYFGIDSTLIRLAFILIVLVRGAGLLAYVIAWIIIPERPVRESNITSTKKEDNFSDYDFNSEADQEIVIEGQIEGNTEINEDNLNEVKTEDNNDQKQRFLGYALIALGAFFLIDRWLPYFRWERFWPLILVVLGITLLVKGVKRNGPGK